MDTITIDGQEITPEAIQVTQVDDGTIRIDTAPLPEYIAVHSDLWDTAGEYTPREPEEGEDQPQPPSEFWLEPLGHADEDKDNDGYVLHIDASNVHAAYKLVQENPDGIRVLRLASWAEL